MERLYEIRRIAMDLLLSCSSSSIPPLDEIVSKKQFFNYTMREVSEQNDIDLTKIDFGFVKAWAKRWDNASADYKKSVWDKYFEEFLSLVR